MILLGIIGIIVEIAVVWRKVIIRKPSLLILISKLILKEHLRLIVTIEAHLREVVRVVL